MGIGEFGVTGVNYTRYSVHGAAIVVFWVVVIGVPLSVADVAVEAESFQLLSKQPVQRLVHILDLLSALGTQGIPHPLNACFAY